MLLYLKLALDVPGESDAAPLAQYDPETRHFKTGKLKSKARLVISPQVAHISDTIIGMHLRSHVI